ncbi:MAG: riboflavin kinase [Collinsella sp.]|nr:riboflavin kinase [Collinsella sp.]
MSDLSSQLSRDICLGGRRAPVLTLDIDAAPASTPLACAVAIGAFDGCHVGHIELLRRTVADARARGIAAVAITFDPDPDEVVSSHPAPKLMQLPERVSALATSGVDLVVVVPFTASIAALGHEGFLRGVLGGILDIRSINVGADFRLGARGASTVEVIRAWGADRGIDVVGHELVLDDGHAITSTRVRSLISRGALDAALIELGRRHAIWGVVQAGRGQGTGMGFPTANVSVPPRIQMPVDGVYAGFAVVGDSPDPLSSQGSQPRYRAWPAAINVGVPPMFADSIRSARLEANLLGFKGDLYGKRIAIVFDRRLRPSTTFEGIDDLIRAVKADIARTRELFGDSEIAIRP